MLRCGLLTLFQSVHISWNLPIHSFVGAQSGMRTVQTLMVHVLLLKKSGYTGGNVLLLGAGGTSRPYLSALRSAGVEGVGRVAIASRAEERAQHTLHVAARLGLDYSWIPLNDPEILRASCHNATLVISTLPGDAAAGYSTFLRRTPRLIDVTYAPWPTSLAQVVADNGGTVVGGRTMLLHQAVAQIEAFTQKNCDR